MFVCGSPLKVTEEKKTILGRFFPYTGPGGEKEEEKKEEEGEGRQRKIDLIVKNCGVLSVRVHAYCIQSHRAY
jgi:hypothetical protein